MIRILDDNGALLDVDAATMDAPTRERYAAVRHAFLLNRDATLALNAAIAEENAALEAIKQTESFHDAHWPRQSAHDLWKENFGGGPRNTMRALGLTRE